MFGQQGYNYGQKRYKYAQNRGGQNRYAEQEQPKSSLYDDLLTAFNGQSPFVQQQQENGYEQQYEHKQYQQQNYFSTDDDSEDIMQILNTKYKTTNKRQNIPQKQVLEPILEVEQQIEPSSDTQQFKEIIIKYATKGSMTKSDLLAFDTFLKQQSPQDVQFLVEHLEELVPKNAPYIEKLQQVIIKKKGLLGGVQKQEQMQIQNQMQMLQEQIQKQEQEDRVQMNQQVMNFVNQLKNQYSTTKNNNTGNKYKTKLL